MQTSVEGDGHEQEVNPKGEMTTLHGVWPRIFASIAFYTTHTDHGTPNDPDSMNLNRNSIVARSQNPSMIILSSRSVVHTTYDTLSGWPRSN